MVTKRLGLTLQLLPKMYMRVFTLALKLAAAVDLEDAYNRVLLDFLMTQFLELNSSLFLLNWISAAIFQQKVVFRCD